MSGFKFFNRRGDCPICRDSAQRKDCRESLITGLFFCQDRSANPAGYVYRGEDANGFGIWQAASDAEEFSQQTKEERERKRKEFIEAEARRKQKRLKRELSPIERDKAYTELKKHLKLGKKHQDILLTRGIPSEQLDEYRSVTSFQKVSLDLPQNLPGILQNGFGGGFCINVHTSGIIRFIENVDGLKVGFQVRLDDTEDSKYRWGTSSTKNNSDGATPHVKGELPLSIVEPENYTGDSIWLAEGTMIKPNLASYKLGVPVVGAAGGMFSSSPETAKASVDTLSSTYRTKTLTFPVDAGDASNTGGVPQRVMNQIKFFESLGYTCRVAWWGQVTKDECDIDELDDISVIKFITPQEFWEICEKHKLKFSEEKSQNQLHEQSQEQKKDKSWDYWLESRKYTPSQDRVVEQKDFDFGSIPDTNAIIAAKSGLSTGKTEAMLRAMKASSRGAVIIGYRNNLLFQTIGRGEEKQVQIYHISDDDSDLMLLDDETNMALCLDSIPRADGYFAGKDVYLDEACSVLLHGCDGGTLGDNQAKVLRILTHALQECNRVFLLDGNLSDIQVKLIAKLTPAKKVIKIENQQKIPPHNITFIEGFEPTNEFENEKGEKEKAGKIKSRDRSPLIEFLLNEDVLPWIACDSINMTKILYKLLTDAGKTGYLLNAETVREPWAKEFMLAPDEFLKRNKKSVQFFIVSPTAESGVSIWFKNLFTHKFSFFIGVLGTNSQHQIMFRLRDNAIPHYVFCPNSSNIRDRSNPSNYSVTAFKQILNDRLNLSAWFVANDSGVYETSSQTISSAFARSNDDWFDYSCKIGAINNYEMDNLKECLIYALTEAGHNVDVLQWDINDEIKAKETEAKEAVRRQHGEELFKAEEFDSLETAKKIAKSNPCKEVQRKIEKTFLIDRLPGIKDTKVWDTDFIVKYHLEDRDFINKQQRFYYLQNFEVSKKRHEADWFYKSTQEDFFKSSMKRTSHLTIWALQQLNILQFLQGEWHKDSPEVIELLEKARTNKDIQTALRIKPGVKTSDGKERIPFISSLLNIIGLKFSKPVRKELKNNNRIRTYSIAEETLNEPVRLAVLNCIEKKQTDWMESKKSKIDWSIEQYQKPEQPAQTVKDSTPKFKHDASTDADEWEKPETIEYVKSLLEDCENAEALALLRASKIPAKIFKLASKLLSPERYEQIRQWVINPLDPIPGF